MDVATASDEPVHALLTPPTTRRDAKQPRSASNSLLLHAISSGAIQINRVQQHQQRKTSSHQQIPSGDLASCRPVLDGERCRRVPSHWEERGAGVVRVRGSARQERLQEEEVGVLTSSIICLTTFQSIKKTTTLCTLKFESRPSTADSRAAHAHTSTSISHLTPQLTDHSSASRQASRSGTTSLAVGRTRGCCEMHCSATAATAATVAAGHCPALSSTKPAMSANRSGSSQ
jgi:hypothetical protein